MRLILFTVIFLGIFTNANADGPAVDEDGNIFVMHIVFYFDSLQLDQIQYSSYFELNDEQMKILLKINPKLERKIFFISPFYDDCICGMSYAIWNKEKSFAVPLYTITNENDELDNTVDEESEIESYEEKSYWDYEETFGAYIFIGTDASLYFDKKRISIEDASSIIQYIAGLKNRSSKFVNIRKPPKINSLVDNKVNEIILKLEEIVRSKSINFQIGG